MDDEGESQDAGLDGPDPASADPEPNLGLLLFIPYRAMETAVLERLAAAGFDDITLAQARVFQRVAPHGSRLSELAEAAQVTKQTVGFLVDQLERAGYVQRTPDPHDGRARRVRVAPRGAEAVRVSAAVVAQVEAEWSARLGPRRTAQLRDALTVLRELTDPWLRRTGRGPGDLPEARVE